MSQLPAPSLIAELEVRQDEALRALAELEQRIEAALSEFGYSPTGSGAKGKKPSATITYVGLKLHAAAEPSQPAAA